MRSRLTTEAPARTFVVVFDPGEEVMAGLGALAASESLEGASVAAIGALRSAELAYFDAEAKQFVDVLVGEPVEVLSLTGTIGRRETAPALHLHTVLGRRDGSTVGGHVKQAVVGPTLEVVVTDLGRRLDRRLDESVGLPVIVFDAAG